MIHCHNTTSHTVFSNLILISNPNLNSNPTLTLNLTLRRVTKVRKWTRARLISTLHFFSPRSILFRRVSALVLHGNDCVCCCQENIATLTSPSNQMTLVYRSSAEASSNVMFLARYWSTFQNQAQTYRQPTTVDHQSESDDYDVFAPYPE